MVRRQFRKTFLDAIETIFIFMFSYEVTLLILVFMNCLLRLLMSLNPPMQVEGV